MQKMLLVYDDDFRELDALLGDGWHVQDFKPLPLAPQEDTGFTNTVCAYVLLEAY